MHSHRFCFLIFFVSFGTGKAIASRIPWTTHSAVCVIPASPASETIAYSASQKCLRILCKLKVPYRAPNSPTLVPIVNQINSITTFQPNPIKANCNTSIIESTTISVKFQANIQVSAKKLSCIAHLCHLCLWYEGPTNNFEDYKLRSSSLCSFLNLSVISSILSSSIRQLLQGKVLVITEVFWMWRQIAWNCDSSTQRGWHKIHTWVQITFRRGYSRCETQTNIYLTDF
jgi:hypothetical protein